jgi:hypothetical protein
MGRPAWFNPGTYNWTPSMGHDIGDWSPQTQANVQQQWWRDPSWGGHIIWNPQYGFQNLGSVQDFYKSWDPSTTPNFSKAFRQAGFTKQLSDAGNWSQFYPDRPVVQNQQYGQQPAQGQYQWGQPPPAPQSAPAQEESETSGFYAPKYGSTVSQYLPRQSRGQGYGRDTGDQYTAPSQGRYYGTDKKRNTSMRYGYRPSM